MWDSSFKERTFNSFIVTDNKSKEMKDKALKYVEKGW